MDQKLITDLARRLPDLIRIVDLTVIPKFREYDYDDYPDPLQAKLKRMEIKHRSPSLEDNELPTFKEKWHFYWRKVEYVTDRMQRVYVF